MSISNELAAIARQNRSDRRVINFKDGIRLFLTVYIYTGACLVGDPTAYVYRAGEMLWVKEDPTKGWIEC